MNKLTTTLLMSILLAGPSVAQSVAQRDGESPSQRPEARQRDDRNPPRDRQGRDRWELTQEQMPQAIAIVERLKPELAEQLRQAAEESPRQAAALIRDQFPRLYELLRIQREDPDRFELHVQSIIVMRQMFSLMREYRQAKEQDNQEAVAQLRTQLRTHIEQMYDIRMRQHDLEIQQLEAQLAERRQRREDAMANREEHINEILERVEEGDMRHGGPHRPEAGREGQRPDGADSPPMDERPREGQRPRNGQRPDRPRRGGDQLDLE